MLQLNHLNTASLNWCIHLNIYLFIYIYIFLATAFPAARAGDKSLGHKGRAFGKIERDLGLAHRITDEEGSGIESGRQDYPKPCQLLQKKFPQTHKNGGGPKPHLFQKHARIQFYWKDCNSFVCQELLQTWSEPQLKTSLAFTHLWLLQALVSGLVATVVRWLTTVSWRTRYFRNWPKRTDGKKPRRGGRNLFARQCQPKSIQWAESELLALWNSFFCGKEFQVYTCYMYLHVIRTMTKIKKNIYTCIYIYTSLFEMLQTLKFALQQLANLSLAAVFFSCHLTQHQHFSGIDAWRPLYQTTSSYTNSH